MANTVESANVETVHAYLTALENGVCGEQLTRFFHPDARQVELPNRLNPNGAESDLATIEQRCEKGWQVVSRQRFEVISTVAQGDRVAVEAMWTAVLKVPFGSLAAGDAMTAHLAMFFVLAEGRILLQRNYDCFQPF